MQSKNVLQEFLVSLGFKIDEGSARKFMAALGSAGAVAAKTGASVVGAATAVEAYVQVFASSMEKLYYASKRTESSAANIQALEFGAKKIGVAGDEARSSLEAMAQTLRMNPGMRSMLDNLLGYRTQGVDNTKVLKDLVAKLGTMPHFLGARVAGMFGMDEKTFFMLKRELPKLRAEEEKFLAMQKRAGVDPDKADAASVRYKNTLGDLWAQVTILGQAFAIVLMPSLQKLLDLLNPLIERFSRWVGLHKEVIQERLDKFLEGLAGWLEELNFDQIFDDLDKFLKKVDEIVASMGGWKTIGKAVALISFAPLITALGTVLTVLLSSFAPLITALGTVLTVLLSINKALAVPFIAGTTGYLLGKWLVGLLSRGDYEDQESKNILPFKSGRIKEDPNGPSSRGSDGTTLFADAYNRLRELTNDTFSSADQSPGTVAKRNDEMARLFKAIAPQGGTVSFGGGSQAAAGGGGISLTQKTDIHVAGGNAQEIATNVMQGQGRVNSDLADMVRYANKAQ